VNSVQQDLKLFAVYELGIGNFKPLSRDLVAIFELWVNGVGLLFTLTAAGCHFPSARLLYQCSPLSLLPALAMELQQEMAVVLRTGLLGYFRFSLSPSFHQYLLLIY